MWTNDENMTYDLTMHKYVLTETAIFNELGENLNTVFADSPDVPTKTAFLKDVTRQFYGYVYSHSQSQAYIEYILAMDENLRSLIFDALIAQAAYMLNGGNVAKFSGINLAKMQWIDLDKLRGDARVAVEVVDICNQILPGYDRCLIYAGHLPSVPPSVYHNGY